VRGGEENLPTTPLRNVGSANPRTSDDTWAVGGCAPDGPEGLALGARDGL